MVLLRLPSELWAGRNDVLHSYLMVCKSHDSASPLWGLLTTFRVVCANTLALAFRGRELAGVAIRDLGELQARVEKACQRL